MEGYACGDCEGCVCDGVHSVAGGGVFDYGGADPAGVGGWGLCLGYESVGVCCASETVVGVEATSAVFAGGRAGDCGS